MCYEIVFYVAEIWNFTGILDSFALESKLANVVIFWTWNHWLIHILQAAWIKGCIVIFFLGIPNRCFSWLRKWRIPRDVYASVSSRVTRLRNLAFLGHVDSLSDLPFAQYRFLEVLKMWFWTCIDVISSFLFICDHANILWHHNRLGLPFLVIIASELLTRKLHVGIPWIAILDLFFFIGIQRQFRLK